jgi:hypothetical protein
MDFDGTGCHPSRLATCGRSRLRVTVFDVSTRHQYIGVPGTKASNAAQN